MKHTTSTTTDFWGDSESLGDSYRIFRKKLRLPFPGVGDAHQASLYDLFTVTTALRRLEPEYVIDAAEMVGVDRIIKTFHDGEFLAACPRFPKSFDVHQHPEIDYRKRTVEQIDWSHIAGRKTLAIFNNHVSADYRLRFCAGQGIDHALFLVNYPLAGVEGYYMKQAVDEFSFPANVKSYVEFPPLWNLEGVFHDKPWDYWGVLPPIFEPHIPELEGFMDTDMPSYSWPCYVQLRKN